MGCVLELKFNFLNLISRHNLLAANLCFPISEWSHLKTHTLPEVDNLALIQFVTHGLESGRVKLIKSRKCLKTKK